MAYNQTDGATHHTGDVGSLSLTVDDDGIYRPLRTDFVSHALTTIDQYHHEIHEGDAYCVYNTDTSVASGDFISIYLKTPPEILVHVFYNWQSGGAAYFRMRAFPVVTANTGTSFAVRNRNRGSLNTSQVYDNATTPLKGAVMKDVTIADRTSSIEGDKGGLVIYEEYDGIAKQMAGGNRSDQEFILKNDAVYVFEVESAAAGIACALQLGWYEVTLE